MLRRFVPSVMLTVCGIVFAGGCMPKMTIEEMKAEMPKRPAELDRLNDFAGTWEFEGTAKFTFLDEALKTTGTSQGKWEGDGWYLVIHNAFNMCELGDMKSIETWTYDTHSKKYRSTWVDSMGSLSTGSTTYDEETRTWKMKARSYGPHGKTTMKGTFKFIDDDTMEWCVTEHAGLMKIVEMSGTGKRRE